jgi:hypothetical protein
MAEETGFHGASSAVWFFTFVIVVGTIVGAVGLIEWIWPAFWVGVGLFLIGSVAAAFSGIMESVSEFGPPAGSDQ